MERGLSLSPPPRRGNRDLPKASRFFANIFCSLKAGFGFPKKRVRETSLQAKTATKNGCRKTEIFGRFSEVDTHFLCLRVTFPYRVYTRKYVLCSLLKSDIKFLKIKKRNQIKSSRAMWVLQHMATQNNSCREQ